MANAMNNEKTNKINLIDVLSDSGEQKTCLKRCKGSILMVEDTTKGIMPELMDNVGRISVCDTQENILDNWPTTDKINPAPFS